MLTSAHWLGLHLAVPDGKVPTDRILPNRTSRALAPVALDYSCSLICDTARCAGRNLSVSFRARRMAGAQCRWSGEPDSLARACSPFSTTSGAEGRRAACLSVNDLNRKQLAPFCGAAHLLMPSLLVTFQRVTISITLDV